MGYALPGITGTNLCHYSLLTPDSRHFIWPKPLFIGQDLFLWSISAVFLS